MNKLGKEFAMQDATCSIDGCETPANRTQKTLCEKHYYRIRRYGDPSANRNVSKLHGATCYAENCQKPRRAGRWCSMHQTRLERHKTLEPAPLIAYRRDVAHLVERTVSYDAMHWRVKSWIGKAPEFACVDCGQQASSWSYDHQDNEELLSSRGLYPYSLDPSHYAPRCSSCHTTFDRKNSYMKRT